LGGAASVSTLKAKDIEDFLSQVLNSKNLVLAVAGDFNPKEWIKKIENITERIAMSSSKLKLGQINNKISMPALSQNKQTFIETKKSQAHLALAYPGISFHDKDRYSLEILQAVLSGQGGRLFVELRDKASLAYTVAPIRMDGLERGYFGAYIGCSPEKVDTAYQMMLVEFKKLIENLVPSTELDRSKKFLTGRHDISLQRASTIADHLFFNQLYELPPKEFENYNANIQAVTAKDIQKVAERIFTQHFVLSIVGAIDVARVDTPSAQTRPAELI
jgi:zinc protease